MNDQKIEQSNERCFGLQQLLANSKSDLWVVAALYLQSIKNFLTVELSQYRKCGSTFFLKIFFSPQASLL